MYIYISNLKSRSPAEIKEIRRHPEGGTNFFLKKGEEEKVSQGSSETNVTRGGEKRFF